MTLTVGNSVLPYAFSDRIIDGLSYKLNTGKIGLGCNGSVTSFDNVAVQKLAPLVSKHTLDRRKPRREDTGGLVVDGPVHRPPLHRNAACRRQNSHAYHGRGTWLRELITGAENHRK